MPSRNRLLILSVVLLAVVGAFVLVRQNSAAPVSAIDPISEATAKPFARLATATPFVPTPTSVLSTPTSTPDPTFDQVASRSVSDDALRTELVNGRWNGYLGTSVTITFLSDGSWAQKEDNYDDRASGTYAWLEGRQLKLNCSYPPGCVNTFIVFDVAIAEGTMAWKVTANGGWDPDIGDEFILDNA